MGEMGRGERGLGNLWWGLSRAGARKCCLPCVRNSAGPNALFFSHFLLAGSMLGLSILGSMASSSRETDAFSLGKASEALGCTLSGRGAQDDLWPCACVFLLHH